MRQTGPRAGKSYFIGFIFPESEMYLPLLSCAGNKGYLAATNMVPSRFVCCGGGGMCVCVCVCVRACVLWFLEDRVECQVTGISR